MICKITVPVNRLIIPTILMIVFACLLFADDACMAAQPAQIFGKVYINENRFLSDDGLYESQGVILGSARSLAYNMGLITTWDAESQEISFLSGGNLLIMRINSSNYTFNGVDHSLAVAPMLANSRTLVPLQVVVEAFGGIFSVDNSLSAPIVYPVTSTDSTIAGSCNQTGSTITIKQVAGDLVGTGTVDGYGLFSISIPPQSVGTVLLVTATSGDITSDPTTVTVINPRPTFVNYQVYVNGNELQSINGGFYESQGVLLGSVRDLAEAMSIEVQWDSAEQEITFSSGSDSLIMALHCFNYTLMGSSII